MKQQLQNIYFGLKLAVDNSTALPPLFYPPTILLKTRLPTLRAPSSSLLLFSEQEKERPG